MEKEWVSPDDKIFKKVLVSGQPGTKPFENSEVKLNVIDCPAELEPFNNTVLVIGDNDEDLGRLLDICICTMHLKEQSRFTITIGLEQISAVIELVDLKFDGFIYEWDAKKRCSLAERHKEQGVKYFSAKNHFEAAQRFTKALKLVNSIPIAVEPRPETVDNLKVTYINTLKENLYNNLGSCYFRVQVFDLVVPLCQKALAFNETNVKALYKMGVAYENDKDYEKAQKSLMRALELEPQNKACAEHLAYVEAKLKEACARSDNLLKKMIQGSLNK